MAGPRTSALVVALAAAGVGAAVLRHHRSTSQQIVPGGTFVGAVGAYDTMARRVLGSFYSGVAADAAAVAGSSARVLEVGSGPGHLALLLATRHGLELTGIDLDPAMVELARVNASRPANGDARGPTFMVADVASLPFPDGSFDLVVSTLSMHHWADPTRGLAEIGRVLRRDGHALVWDLRPGVAPIHQHVPDPVDHVDAGPLRLAARASWRWPWRLPLTQRLEFVHAAV